jgi:hypothetical protein
MGMKGLLNTSQTQNAYTRVENPIGCRHECSKKSIQTGRSPFDARSVLPVLKHDKRARTPLVAFSNIPIIDGSMRSG